MGLYKEDLVFKPYAFNNSTLTLTRLDTNDIHTAQALNMIAAEMDEDKFSPVKVASGASIQQHNPSRSGKMFLSFMEGSPTTDWIVAANEAHVPIAVAFSDENAADMDCSTRYSFIQKHPRVERTSEVPVPEWTIVADYLKCKAGSFALYETE